MHEKVLNIINHQGNANQNNNELPMHPQQDDYNKKDITDFDENMKKSGLSYIAGKMKWYNHLRKQFAIPQKVKHSYSLTQ